MPSWSTANGAIRAPGLMAGAVRSTATPSRPPDLAVRAKPRKA